MPLDASLPMPAPSRADTPRGRIGYRAACAPGFSGPVTHVLLHGIGSASGSWSAQLQPVARGAGAAGVHLLAWDAPGYGESTPLPMDVPSAVDYADRMWAWLDALGAASPSHPVTLVGHSLGALMAASAAASQGARVARLVLLSPAQGHATDAPAVRRKKLDDRLASLAQLGPAGLARQRAAAMLSPQASPAQVRQVEQVMAAILPRGYTQAAHMLSQGAIATDLARVRCPVMVASGSADTITPAPACRALAQSIGAPYADLGPVGHSSALEAAAAVNRLIGIEGANHGH